MTTDDLPDVSFGGWRGCDACGEAIASIDEAALVLRESLFEERRLAIEEAAAGGSNATLGLLPWDWGHRACFSGYGLRYAIDGPRMDTLPAMMARTLQLLDEDWFLETAWEDAVRRFYRIPFE